MASIEGDRLRHALFFPVYLLGASALVLIIIALFADETWENAWVPIALGALLSGYLAWELRREVLSHGAMALISPAVLASLVHFYMSYCTPMMVLPFDDNMVQTVLFWTKDWQLMGWMSYAMILICVSAFAFWRGYRCFLAYSLANSFKRAMQGTGLIRPGWNLNLTVVFLFAAASLGARLLQIRLGLFGYGANSEALYGLAEYRSYIDYVAALGSLSLFLIAVQTFGGHKGQNQFLPLLLTADFLLEVGFGFLSGTKSQVVVPAILVGAAYFVVRGRLPFKWAIGGVVLCTIAFAIIEPYRHISKASGSEGTSLSLILSQLSAAVTKAAEDDYEGGTGAPSLQRTGFNAFLQRSELVSVTTTGLRYRDTVQELGPDAPDFVGAIVFAPIYAFIPRLMWPDKPLANFGAWFDYRVTGRYAYGVSSTGMGPVSYFYFVGGVTGVVLGFFGLGIWYRVLFTGLTPLGAGGWLIYFALVSNLAIVTSDIGPTLSGLIQLIPLAVIMQALVLKMPKHASSRSNQSQERRITLSG